MGFFFKALAAMVTADAIDRSARRPPRYWYPDQAGRSGSEQRWLAAGWYADPFGQPLWRWWDGGQWTGHTHHPPAR